MSVIEQLASSLGRRDEVPNVELAAQIAAKKDKAAIQELVGLLSGKRKDIQHDCIKVLYEIGDTDPALIAPYVPEFLALLDHKDYRLQWGAMTALSCITPENPAAIYAALPKIVAAADKGSVITRDNAVHILIRLCSVKQYATDAVTLLNEQLLRSPANQLPIYAERAMPIINIGNQSTFVRTLQSRLDDIGKDSKRKRVEQVIRKLGG